MSKSHWSISNFEMWFKRRLNEFILRKNVHISRRHQCIHANVGHKLGKKKRFPSMFLSLRVCGIHFNHGVFEGFNHIQCVHACVCVCVSSLWFFKITCSYTVSLCVWSDTTERGWVVCVCVWMQFGAVAGAIKDTHSYSMYMQACVCVCVTATPYNRWLFFFSPHFRIIQIS